MAAAMAEEQGEVNYASVVFKANKHPPSEGKTEETVYDEVKVQTADAGLLADRRANNRHRHFKWLACGLGILSVILLSGIIAVCVYIVTLSHENESFKEIQKNHLAVQQNLTKRIDKLSSMNENLTRDANNLTVQMSNLTQSYAVLENKITNLTEENTNLTEENKELKTLKNKLTEQIQEMKANNISRAQWSIDAYCPKNNRRQCRACQMNWELTEPNCYIFYNSEKPERITWEEAQENCRGKNSDLAVIRDEGEKDAINEYNKQSSGTNGYWIGLRVKDGQWKWIDGSDLTVTDWSSPTQSHPTEGHCAISVHDEGWESVRCDGNQRWICRQKALSV